jgi:hypothetical protein
MKDLFILHKYIENFPYDTLIRDDPRIVLYYEKNYDLADPTSYMKDMTDDFP